MKTLIFAGGDRRSLIAAEAVRRQGYAVLTYALPHRTPLDGRAAEALILPWPCLKQGRLNAPLTDRPPTLEEMIRETGIPLDLPVIGGPLAENPFSDHTDLSRQESLKLRNAVTTAEGAVDLLIRHTDRAVFGMNCLIIGNGAIGKRLADLLAAFGARVTVAARKETDRVKIALRGHRAIHTDSLDLRGFSAVFNTVPTLLVTEAVLSGASADTVYFELASSPGGIDRQAAEARKITVVDGPGLPGKVAPVTAGEDLAKTILELLSP